MAPSKRLHKIQSHLGGSDEIEAAQFSSDPPRKKSFFHLLGKRTGRVGPMTLTVVVVFSFSLLRYLTLDWPSLAGSPGEGFRAFREAVQTFYIVFIDKRVARLLVQ